MIVERHVYAVKPGRARDFVRLLQEIWGWLDSPVAHRIYRPISGSANTVIQEMEFEDFGARQKWRADLFGRPEWSAAMARWHELEEFGSSVEFFRLVG